LGEAHRRGLGIIGDIPEPHAGAGEILKERSDLKGRILE
jgi:hypothetical protein